MSKHTKVSRVAHAALDNVDKSAQENRAFIWARVFDEGISLRKNQRELVIV